MDYEVSLTEVESRPTAVVAATTTWQEFPTLWGQLLGEVWDCLHAGGIYRGCRNIMLYLDGVPNVEVGVLLDQPCPLTGRVVASALPAGTAPSPGTVLSPGTVPSAVMPPAFPPVTRPLPAPARRPGCVIQPTRNTSFRAITRGAPMD